MKSLLKLFSVIGLLLTAVPSFFVFAGKLSIEHHYRLMFIGMIVWFLSAPLWMLKRAE